MGRARGAHSPTPVSRRRQPRFKLVSAGIHPDRRQKATVQSNEGYKIPGGRRKRNARGRQEEEESLEGMWDSWD